MTSVLFFAVLDPDSPFFSVRELHQKRGHLPPSSRCLVTETKTNEEEVLLQNLALGQSASSMSAFTKAKAAAAKILRTIDHRPGIDWNSKSGMGLPFVTRGVELRSIEFSYRSRPDIRILSDSH
ncbi:hypothetical protein MRB53_013992 [Persea americana]|uniref:Uncharacterized protein n=1 Tax=Persea americana TaxID=3435 RepID=A0ACC2K9N8_PERAE|nr:hypothetical protein MRB53_013992 [Persea americana]